MSDQHICQVALCAHNAAQLRDWYRDVFGMARGAGLLLSAPPMNTDRIQGVSPNPVEKITWLVDQQDYFQLEFFQYYRPRSKLKPAGWRPCDIGYNMMGIYAGDFDRVLAGAAAHSDRPLSAPVGTPGDRRACLQDPEGNWVEVLERDPLTLIEGADPCVVRPEIPAATRFMRLSVPELEKSRDVFVAAMGLSEVIDFELHSPEHEALWGLPGARTKTALLRGSNFLVELVEYQDPMPAPRPAGYQICDQGFMNIAIGYHTAAAFDRGFAHATGNGMCANGEPVDAGLFRVMYVNDPQGFSVEMLYARRALWSLSGFNVGEPCVANEITIRAPVEKTWNRLVDHAGLGDWSIFNSRVLRPGHDAPGGPGCLRELTVLGLRLTEEVTAWEKGRHYRYRLRSGAPFRWHHGDIFVSDDRGASRVRWAIRFESRIPFTGRITAWCLGLVFRRALQTLREQLEAAQVSASQSQ